VEPEWDAKKAAANRRKHGVDFADAATALHDDGALTIRDDDPREERCVTIGMDALGRVLVLVYTHRPGRVRLIPARRATQTERKQYSEQKP
jgi:uncharacterized DUF497 family protein